MIPRPLFIGLGMVFPLPLMVFVGGAAGNSARSLMGSAGVAIFGMAFIFIGIYRLVKASLGGPRSGYVEGVRVAAEEAHQALLEAGEDPRAADSLRNRVRGACANLEAL